VFRLDELGWGPVFENHLGGEDCDGLVPARVAEEARGVYRVYAEAGEWLAGISGKLRFDAAAREDLPAVGDWVLVRPRSDEDRATIQRVLPRRSKFSRKAAGARTDEQIVAANVDSVFLVSSLNREFNLRRIERYLTLVWESGARPVVVLNKADLCENATPYIAGAESVTMGVPVHVTSAVTGAGIDALRAYFKAGRTVALLGSSGVGKTSLINRLRGDDSLRTLPIRASDDRGRHATTSRQLILLDGGGLLIDTPGMRELQLWDSADGLAHAFADIEALALQCHFTACRHLTEPRCAVQQAIAEGALDAARLESYRKLEREQAYLERKKDVVLEAAHEKSWRKIHKDYKRLQRFRDRNRWSIRRGGPLRPPFALIESSG
jgi:ribosome biogenesis GTPase